MRVSGFGIKTFFESRARTAQSTKKNDFLGEGGGVKLQSHLHRCVLCCALGVLGLCVVGFLAGFQGAGAGAGCGSWTALPWTSQHFAL